MYPLPENPSARDIIARSMACHPSLFREMLDAREAEDRRYAQTGILPRTRDAVYASADAANRASECVENDDIDNLMAACGPMVIALNVACKLQCLPPHVRTAAAVRWEEGVR